MDVGAYLDRLDYRGDASPTIETLRALQLAHLLTVPFENLSIHAGEPIVLDDEALFDKVVRRRRGGFCYELNGLFAWLLRALGYDVTMLSAGVARDTGGYSPDFDHMALLVKLERDWLVDVGFGDTFREPLPFPDAGVHSQYGRAYRIVSGGDRHVLMERAKQGGEWKAQYRFGLAPHRYEDYAERCRYHQTSPESHFTQRRLCTRALPDGRVTLSEMRLITTTLDGDRRERTLANEREYAAVLRERFGIVMDGGPAG